MNSINIKKEVQGKFEDVITNLTAELKTQGFGILSRIDLHEKFKEKLNKEVRPVSILGACNPALAYEAYQTNPDVASLLPCNAVVRDLGEGKVSVELVKPTFMMEMLNDPKLIDAAKAADKSLFTVLEKL